MHGPQRMRLLSTPFKAKHGLRPFPQLAGDVIDSWWCALSTVTMQVLVCSVECIVDAESKCSNPCRWAAMGGGATRGLSMKERKPLSAALGSRVPVGG